MMTTENGCDTPLPNGGQDLNALYFTKAPGEEYLRVYAQYNNDPCWVPLPVTLPAFPDLQQARDAGRNISIPSGSFEDAHFYLRSADGNNMTTAYFTNAAGGGIQVGNADDYAALNLQPDGGLLTYGGAEVATEDWVNNHTLPKRDTPVTNFNTVTLSGIYTITSNLETIPNYPHIGGNNNGATSGYLVVYQNNGNAIQTFYPTNESLTMNRGGGYWYRRSATDVWEYKDAVLYINNARSPVHANSMEVSGDYIITGNRSLLIAQGYPDPGADIPFMLTVRKRWGNVPNNYIVSQEAISLQESAANLTRKWIRSRYNWNGGNAWDGWNQVGLLRDVYSKGQLNTSGAGGAVHWDNVSNKPVIVSTETDPTVPAHVKAITQDNIDSWSGKENAANKSTAATLGASDILFPTQKAVKTYVDTAITTNNAGYIPVGQKGVANGVATLGSNGKIPDAQIPAIAITNTSTIASEAAMLALTAETGDVAVRTDLNKSFILQSMPASTLANWVELRSPTVANSDQVPEGITNLYFTNARSRNAISGVSPVTYNSTSGQIGIAQSGSGANGYLSAADWSAFNSKEPAIVKNTAFNKNFGTTSGTIAEGNDSRINNGQTAFSWGNHAAAGYLKTETDPVYNAAESRIIRKREGVGGNVSLANAFAPQHGFAYPSTSDGAGIGGPYITFGGLEYSAGQYVNPVMQLMGAYNGNGTEFKIRTYNSDIATWNPWRRVYTNADSVLTTVPSLQQVLNAGNAGDQFAISSYGNSWNTNGYGIFKLSGTTPFEIAAAAAYQVGFRAGANGIKISTAALTASRNVSFADEDGTVASREWVAGQLDVFGNGFIRNQASSPQAANMYINGAVRADKFVASLDGSYLSMANEYWGLYNAANAAHPLKTGGLTVSDSYTDSAPVNGLLVKGNTKLRGDKTIVGRPIDYDEEITLVLGYSDIFSNYEKVKLIAQRRQDGAARQDFHIAINSEYSSASATISDSRLKIDGITGEVSLAQLRGTGARMVVANDAGVLTAQPLPVDTSIYSTNGALTGSRTVNVGVNLLDFQAANNNRISINGGNNQAVGITSPYMILVGDGSSGTSVPNALNIRYGGQAYVGVKTTNITAARTHQLPDNNGTYVLSVNGVPADSAGNISLSSGSNWWQHNDYPSNWVVPRNTDSGPALGLETGGGLATQGMTTVASDMDVKADDYTLIFGKSVNLKLPNPTEFPRRMLRLRVRKGATISFLAFSVYDIDSHWSINAYSGCDDGCDISTGRTIDIQSIKDEAGNWRWFITALIN